MSKVTDLVGVVTGFLTKHSGELSTVTNVLKTVVSTLPLNAAAQTKVHDALNGLSDASARIGAAAADLAKNPPQNVVIKKSDIIEAVNEVLPALVEAAVTKALAAKGTE